MNDDDDDDCGPDDDIWGRAGHWYDRAGHQVVGHRNVLDLFNSDRRVDSTEIDLDGVTVRVSTVHLVFDHSLGEDGPPLIFETMVFGIGDDEFQWRYTTEGQAQAGHNRVVNLLRTGRLDTLWP